MHCHAPEGRRTKSGASEPAVTHRCVFPQGDTPRPTLARAGARSAAARAAPDNPSQPAELQATPRNRAPSATLAGLSSSFIDFINRVAHAKAVDESERGFFLRYTTRLAEDPRTTLAPEFDVLLPQRAWSFNTMNRQASHFNQMVGGLLGIEHAHHYLIHPQADVRRITAELAQAERDFFAMDAKPRKIGPIGKSSFNR